MSDYYPDTIATLPLFAQRAPAVNGSVTSAMAADSLEQKTLNAMQRRVLELLRENTAGLTDEEMQHRLRMNPSTQRPRRIELVAKGMIVQAGEGKTRSGRRAVKWQITAACR